jgi:hypothetical protein
MPPGPFPELPGLDVTSLFNERGVLKAEKHAWEMAAGRPGLNVDSPYLPGGRILRWPEQTELNALMNEGYGFNTLIDEMMRVHAPFTRTADGSWGAARSGKDLPGSFYWVQPHTPGETRAYGRIGVERSALLEREAPEMLYALSQTNIQYREERMNMMKAGKLRRLGQEDWSSVFVPSGTRPTLDSVRRLMKQRKHFLDEEGTKVIFDLETASLMPEHGIRQLSYRVINPAGKQTQKTLNFQNAIMGLGHYSDTLEGIQGKIVDGQIVRGGLLPQERMAEELTEFFSEAGSARYLIGQNAMFDVGMLQQIKQQDIWKHGERLLEGAGGDEATIDKFIRGLSGRDKAAVELHRAGTKFFETAHSDKFVDTAAHARILMAQVGGNRLEVAKEIAARGEAKLFSIENIVLQSSFLQDIVDQGLADKTEIQQMFTGGLHSADVDTFFTEKLAQLQSLVYHGAPGGPKDGQFLLRPKQLDQQMIDHIWGDSGIPVPDVGTIRKMISSSRAITPFTNLDMTTLKPAALETLKEIGGREWVDELVAGKRHITGFEHMMLLTRDMAVTSPAAAANEVVGGVQDMTAAQKLAHKSGLFSQFLKDRNILDEMGGLNPLAKLPNEQEWKVASQQFGEAGYHFGGLSFGERMVSQLFSEASSAGNVDYEGAMKALANAAPVSIWRGSSLAAFPTRRAPRIGAIPVEYLKAMEAAGEHKGVRLLHGTQFAAAEEGKAVQFLSVSPFEYRDWRNRAVQDVGLSVRGAVASDPTQRDTQISAIIDWVRQHEKETLKLPEEKRASEEALERLAQGLKATGHTTGIQVATMAGQGGSKGATRVFNLLKHLGYDVDRASTGWALPYLFGRTLGEGKEAVTQIGAAPAISAAGGLIGPGQPATPKAATLMDNILEQNRRLKEGYAGFEREVLPDARILTQLNRGWDAKISGMAEKLPRWVTEYVTPQLRGRTAAIAGGAAALGYMWHRHKKNAAARDVMDRQEFEDPGFYARYKRSMDEPVPVTPIADRGRNMYALATADLPAYLDDSKIGHTNMSSDKYSHLFGG